MEHNTRVEQIKTYLERLSAGEELEKVRADFAKEFKAVDPAEIMPVSYTHLDVYKRQDIQHGPSHRRGGIKLFRRGHKLHIVLLEQLHHVGKVQNLSLIHI